MSTFLALTVHIRAQRSPDPQSDEFEFTVIVNVNVDATNNSPSQFQEGKHVANG